VLLVGLRLLLVPARVFVLGSVGLKKALFSLEAVHVRDNWSFDDEIIDFQRWRLSVVEGSRPQAFSACL